jgi:polyhydroxyalkanoate synthesis regulator phasin
MNKKILGLGLGAGLAASTLGLIAVPAISGAQTADPATTATAPAGRPDHSARFAETLAPLVADGTITQTQSDAVVAELVANGPKGGMRGGGHGPGLDVAAQALGMTTDELHTALDGGSTLAQVAADKGVDVQVIVDALVASARNHIAQEVTDGEITQEQADQKLADVDQRVTDMVNGVRPQRGAKDGAQGGPREGRGPRGQQGAPAQAPAIN